MSFGDSSSQTQTQQQATRTPYQPFVSGLDTIASTLKGLLPGSGSLTPTQSGAISGLEATAANPWATTITDAAGKVLGGSQAPTVAGAYKTLQDQLGPTANGTTLASMMASPEVASMLGTIRSDVSNDINGRFAAAGRDPVGNGAAPQAIARGIAQGESAALVPLLEDQQNKQLGAASTLYGAGNSTAGNVQALNEDAATTGTGLASAGVQAAQTGPMNTLAAEAMKLGIPISNLQGIASILFPGSQLGGTTTGTGTSNTDSSSFGITGKDIGTGLTGLAAIMPFL